VSVLCMLLTSGQWHGYGLACSYSNLHKGLSQMPR
jgi:hypothetical protein